MPGALKSLVPTQFLTNAVATYYTAPVALQNAVTAVHSFILANTDTAAHTITMHNVPVGGTASNGNRIGAAWAIPANKTWIGKYADEPFCVVPAGGTIQAFADANSVVTLTMGGREHQ